MREWIDDLSDWMDGKEKISVLPPLLNEAEQTSHDTELLLQTSEQLRVVYSKIKGKIEHANSR